MTSDIELAAKLRVVTPNGSGIADAKRTLEHGGFTCGTIQAETLQTVVASRFALRCARRESSPGIPLMRTWRVLYQTDSAQVLGIDVRVDSSWP